MTTTPNPAAPVTSMDHLWMLSAACANNPELFDRADTAMRRPGSGDNDLVVQEAKLVCHRCPVVQKCLITAYVAEGTATPASRFSIRGGLTGQERYEQEMLARSEERGS